MTNHDNRETEDLRAQDGQKPVALDLSDADIDVVTMNPDYDHPHFKEKTASTDDIDLLLDGNPFDLDGPDSYIRLILRILLNLLRFPLILVGMVKSRIDSHKFDRTIELSPAFDWIKANRPLRVHRGK